MFSGGKGGFEDGRLLFMLDFQGLHDIKQLPLSCNPPPELIQLFRTAQLSEICMQAHCGGWRDTMEELTNSGRVEGSGLKTKARPNTAESVLM